MVLRQKNEHTNGYLVFMPMFTNVCHMKRKKNRKRNVTVAAEIMVAEGKGTRQ